MMIDTFRVEMGFPALLEFRGPDAVRFLNGQMTQDVKKAGVCERSVSSCITDAKGKLQFRVYVMQMPDGALRISAPEGSGDSLEARLTKYLIADDVEVENLSGKYRLYHLVGAAKAAEGNAWACRAMRFGVWGTDFWVPAEETLEFPGELGLIGNDELEAVRILHGAPAWGSELTEGMLPQEADLEETDISYEKGCYIGQEVISRIKSAGKVNRSLLSLTLAADVPAKAGDELIARDASVGILSSVSPIARGDCRDALGFVKRGGDRGNLQVRTGDGGLYPVAMRS